MILWAYLLVTLALVLLKLERDKKKKRYCRICGELLSKSGRICGDCKALRVKKRKRKGAKHG